MAEKGGRSKLLDKLKSKSNSIKKSHNDEIAKPKGKLQFDAPERLPFSALQGKASPNLLVAPAIAGHQSNVWSLPVHSPASHLLKPYSVCVGSLQVPLSSVVFGIALLFILYILWRAFIASIDTLIHLLVSCIIAAAFLLLTPLVDKLQILPNWINLPKSSAFI